MSDSTTPPQFDQSPGMAGQSPAFWSNVANFGGNLAVASNARNGQGFLTYGQGAAGPIGAAVLANQQQQQQNPFLAAELQRARLGNQSASMQNQLTQMRMPLEQAQTAALTNLYKNGLPGVGTTPDQGGAATGGTAAAPSGGVPSTAPQQQRIKGFEGGDYSAMNSGGYAGAYSMGTAALADAGVYKPAPGENLNNNEWKGTINVAPYKPTTIAGFLANPAMQDAAYGTHMQNVDKQIKTLGLDQYVGQTVGGVPITSEDLQNGVHFAGAGNMQNWLQSGGKTPWKDGNGVTIPQGLAAMRGTPPQTAGTGQPQQGGADQNATAQANHYYALAQQSALLNPTLSATYKDMGDKWFDVAQTGPKAGAAANAEAPAALRRSGFQTDNKGNLSPIPGGPADPAYVGQKAAAEALAKAQNENISLRGPGSAAVSGSGRVIAQIPEHFSRTNPDGSVTEFWAQPLEGATPGGRASPAGPAQPGGPASGAAQPGSAGPAASGLPAPFTSKISPLTEDFLKGRGEDLAKQFHEIDTSAEAAKETSYQIDNMRQASLNFPMGAWADYEQGLRTNLAAAGKTMGLDTSSLDNPSANYQAFGKAAGQLVRSAMHETGGRAAAEYSMIQKSLPAPTNVQEGFNTVADQIQGVADYHVARQKFAQTYRGNPQDFNVAFNSTMSPTSFMINRMALTPSGQARLQGMVANMQGSDGGRKLLKGMMDQYKNAKDGGYFEGLGIGDAPQGAPNASAGTAPPATPTVQRWDAP